MCAADKRKATAMIKQYNLNTDVLPKIYLFAPGQNHPIPYDGEMKLKYMYDFVNSYIPEAIQSPVKLNSPSSLPKVIYIPKNEASLTPPWYKGVTMRLSDYVEFYQGT